MIFFRAISNLLRFDRTNWKALALCFFAAAVFWIFNALNKNYATNIRFPLQFEFDSKIYIPVDPLPETLTLNVSGNGWELLRKSLSLKGSIISLPLERPAETRKIVAATLSPIVASQLGTLQVNFIVTDTLQLKIEPKARRKIRLEANLKDVSFKKTFGRISEVVILPDSVVLEGPKSLIESLHDTVVLNLNTSRINQNYSETVEVVIKNYDLISRNPPVAEVMFDVGLVDDVERAIKLKMSKLPWGTEVEKDSVSCLFRVPQNEYARFLSDVSAISASFQFTEMIKGEIKSFLPRIEGLPPYAILVHIDSIKVKRY